MPQQPRRFAGKWVLLALALAVTVSIVGLIRWTRATPLVPDAEERGRAKTSILPQP